MKLAILKKKEDVINSEFCSVCYVIFGYSHQQHSYHESFCSPLFVKTMVIGICENDLA